MEILRPTHIDFLGKRYIFFALSGIILAISLWALGNGINKGIDFAGGTEIQVKFAEAPALDILRGQLNDLGLGDVSLQSIGAVEEHELVIRVGSQQQTGVAAAQERDGTDAQPVPSPPATDEPQEQSAGQTETPAAAVAPNPAPVVSPAEPAAKEGEQTRVYHAVLEVLRTFSGADTSGAGIDLNMANSHEISLLLAAGPGGESQAGSLATAIAAYRRDHAGLFLSFSDLDQVEGMTPQVRTYLEANTLLGPFTVRRVEFVGPQIGGELAWKAQLGMGLALAGMLLYITIRFRNLGFALGGIVALIHDGIIAAGMYDLWGGQFDLILVAAILTLLGYSINDTIVIFDRVRENMRLMRGSDTLSIFNTSINQTLSRTLLTSMTTLLVVVSLFLFGGETIHGFAFLLMFGIVVGTYSTIFIASPVVILYGQWRESRKVSTRQPVPVAAAIGEKKSRNKRRSAGRR
ncbi:MAG: protein translocase subunit SecF [Acidobacteria bacterium]|nr:protein translocase subunit SecF [Acidobacteriota bacterium]